MELKGELKPGGLPTLFRNFATENFTGVLTVTSSVGEKLITLSESDDHRLYGRAVRDLAPGQHSFWRAGKSPKNSCRPSSRISANWSRARAWARCSSAAASRPNKCARTLNVSRSKRTFAIFSPGKEARFVFARGDSAREIRPEDFATEQVHRISIDPDSFFRSVRKLSDQWDSVGDRLPTQYLCFRLSLRADTQVDTLSARSGDGSGIP